MGTDSATEKVATDARETEDIAAEAAASQKRKIAFRSTGYGGTLFIFLILAVQMFGSFLLQATVALLTHPLLFIPGQSWRFYYVQSVIWRTTTALVVIGLNPLWSVTVVREGLAGPPKGGKGSVIFCNHRSNVDPYVCSWVQLRCGIEARYIYKSSLNKIPFAGWNCFLAGDLAVTAGDKVQVEGMIQRAKEILNTGCHIIVFPEGTRSPSGLLQQFKHTFFDICCELGAPAVPLCLLGTELAVSTGSIKAGSATVTAVLGEPIMPGEGGSVALTQAVEESIKKMAKKVLKEDSDDPLITNRPYSWWSVPSHLKNMSEEERFALLRAGKGHQRGKSIL